MTYTDILHCTNRAVLNVPRIVNRRSARSETMAKGMTLMFGQCSVTATTGSGTKTCVSNMWAPTFFWVWQGSSMDTPSGVNVKCTPWDLPTNITGGAPWRASSFSRARNQYATTSSDLRPPSQKHSEPCLIAHLDQRCKWCRIFHWLNSGFETLRVFWSLVFVV